MNSNTNIFKRFIQKISQGITSILTWFALCLLWCIAQLPLTWILRLGQWIGTAMYYILRRRTQVARRNIQACYPYYPADLHERMTRECIIENIRGFFESAKGWWGNVQPLLDETEVQGIEIIQKAAATNKSILLIGAHFTTLDIVGRLIAEIWPLTIIYRPFNNQLINHIILKARQKTHVHVINKNHMRTLVRHIQQGCTLWYPADQDYGAKNSVFAPFFGITAATLTTTAGLAKLCNSHVIGLYHHRMPDNRYRIEFVEIPNFPTTNPQAAIKANQVIEAGIRLCPEQYMWIHRRFKTTPKDSEVFY